MESLAGCLGRILSARTPHEHLNRKIDSLCQTAIQETGGERDRTHPLTDLVDGLLTTWQLLPRDRLDHTEQPGQHQLASSTTT